MSEIIDEEAPFLYDDHLGHVTVCPSNLGTALRIACLVSLPILHRNNDTFSEVLLENKLDATHIPSKDESSLFEISNQVKLGFTELQVIEKYITALKVLLKTE